MEVVHIGERRVLAFLGLLIDFKRVPVDVTEVVPCWLGADLYANLLSIEYDRMLALVSEQDEEIKRSPNTSCSSSLTGVSIAGCDSSSICIAEACDNEYSTPFASVMNAVVAG